MYIPIHIHLIEISFTLLLRQTWMLRFSLLVKSFAVQQKIVQDESMTSAR